MIVKSIQAKKLLRSILFILLMGLVGMTQANPVDMQTVREVAVKFVNANARTPLRGAEDLQLVTTYRTESDDAAFHIFNTPTGFVIISADDCATPILGYSDEGRPFDLEDIPIQLQEYLQGFVEQIQYGIENHVHDETTAQQWEMVRSMGHIINQRGTTAVTPLLTSTWNQGCYYNSMCPVNSYGPCGHVVTGCVATSFAQIMHYWGYPTNGMGSHTYTPSGYPEQTVNFSATTYDWANMPNSLSSSSSSTQVNAVATLMWHCGVAVDMSYGSSASGASSSYVATALLNYFGYSDELSVVYRRNYNDADWLTLMKNCLDLSCPIHYSGSNENGGGHAFVCDGYNSDDLLHFNWGWSGSYNGYFSIGALNPGSHSYNSNNMAIINIHPGCTYGTTYQITATADPSMCGTVSGTGTYNCGNVCTLTATANAGYGFKYWTENDEQVSTEANYSFIAMNDRNLVAHFAPPFNISTSVSPIEGGTVTGGGTYYYNQHVTLTAVPNEGYVFDKWTKDGVDFSYYSTLNMNVTEAAEYVAYFEPLDGIEIGVPMSTNAYLPTYSHHSLTQQIYTANEMGSTACQISSVSFFNTETSTSCNLAIYMVNTDKTAFNGTNDWITVTEANQVFSGSVTMAAKSWTTIYFPTPFSYDGSSNVALIIDNNANTYNYGNILCRTFSTNEYQAICINSFNTNYDPYNPSAYTGTRIKHKNHVVFGIPNYDYTVTATVNPANSGAVSGGGSCYLNQPITLTATPNEGYVFDNWTKNGTVVSYLSTYSLTVTESAEYVANLQEITNGFAIGDATNTSYYLPICFYYSLSEQIYTAEEMGGTACQISSVSFFSKVSSITNLHMDIYMVNTDKTSFESRSDWIPVSESNLVFSGNVTMRATGWSTINFDTPFSYDGSSNVALVVDGSSDSYTSSRTFSTDENQAIYIYGTSTNYDPYNPSAYMGTLMNVKNQVVFGYPSIITATANPTGGGTVSGSGGYAYGATCTLTATPNTGYYFLNWTENGTAVSYDASYSFIVDGDRNLVANFVEGESTCSIVFDFHDSANNGWSGNYLVVDYGDGNPEQLTLESGSSISYSREVATGSTIALSWIVGSFTNQCSFDVKFENGVMIYHGSGLSSSFQQELYINCAAATAPHTITAVADPEEGGTVEGAGTYDGGTVITLTATPNAGYSFIHWKENGTVVSSDANYSFIVSSDRNLVAFFSLPLTISVTTNMAAGGTTTGAGAFDYGSYCTLTAIPNDGYLFLNWSKNGEVVSCNATYSFAVTEETEIEAVFMLLEGTLIGQGESTDQYLPSISYYKYSLSQQIYTPEEIGEAGTITSISYYNGGTTKARSYDIYMVHTDKTIFENATDWITVSEADRVYSGSVNMTKGYWTTIDLDTPFAYDGFSNLAIIVDDNSGSKSSGMACRVFNPQCDQTISVNSNTLNYDPFNPSGYSGIRHALKNQIILGFIPFTFTKEINAYTQRGGYYLISVPFEEINPEEVEDMLANVYDLYQYGEAEREWLNYNAEPFNLEAGKGYLYANSDTLMLNFTGTPYNGDGSVILHKTGEGEMAGWNLVGNPFNEIAYIDREFYVMSEDGSRIELAQRNYILPMEGIFVVANEEGEVLTFSTTAPAKGKK
jgi:hypothetical protein